MGDLLYPALREVVYSVFAQQASVKSQIFRKETSKRAYEDNLKIGGLGNFYQKPEGTAISYDDMVQGTRVRTVHATYALGFRGSNELFQDDQYNIINQAAKELGMSANHHQESLAAGVLNDAFSGSTYTGLDSAALCTSHTLLKSGGTFNNSINVPLSQAGMQSAITLFRTITDESGRYLQMQPRKVVIHPDSEWTATVLLETESGLGTSDGDVNPVTRARMGLSTVMWPYLTDTDAWFLMADTAKCGLVWYDRMPLTFDKGKDHQTKDYLFDAMYRASVAIQDWRGVVGSQPA
jgi:hypothetical protein